MMEQECIVEQAGLDRVYRRSTELVAREIAGELLVVPIKGQLAHMHCIFALNEVARFIWERLDGERDLEAIAQEVIQVFDVGIERAREDLLDAVATFELSQLIVEVPAAEAVCVHS